MNTRRFTQLLQSEITTEIIDMDAGSMLSEPLHLESLKETHTQRNMGTVHNNRTINKLLSAIIRIFLPETHISLV